MIEYLVIGAGLAGLVAAGRLSQAGSQVVILDKGRCVGGRMATRRFHLSGKGEEQAIFDHGAQFFTVRDERFASMVAGWLELGIIEEWSRGFATADGSYYADGHPRYRGLPAMTAVARHLARGLDVRLDQRVTEIAATPSGWRVNVQNSQPLKAGTLILTPPVPQSLALLDAGGVELPMAARAALARISYEPCIAVMVQLAGRNQVPEPGGMWPIGGPIAWLADNYRKGVSPAPGAITIHAGPEFSQEHWLSDDQTVAELLLAAAGQWLGGEVRQIQVHRWSYSKPLWIHPEPCLALDQPAPLIFAGDAFAGPRVEGAALSGLAAADARFQSANPIVP